MFTGIVEKIGKVMTVEKAGTNLTFTIQSDLAPELKIDQSIAHNGVCLTVVGLDRSQQSYQVTAIEETLGKTNLGRLKKGSCVNLERAMQLNGRVDGHLVQGHVDGIVRCRNIRKLEGSTIFTFELESKEGGLLIEKGSVTLNGVSLTVFDVTDSHFSVAIIPYTFEHTTFGELSDGDTVNIEYDVIGKYVQKQLSLVKKQL